MYEIQNTEGSLPSGQKRKSSRVNVSRFHSKVFSTAVIKSVCFMVKFD